VIFKLIKFKKPHIYKENIILNIIWYIVNNLIFFSFFPFSNIKIKILKLFGAKIGENVIIKEYVRIKFPKNLIIGNNVWIGSGVWIDNISELIIEDNCCISQDVYFCTGNHNVNLETFDLIAKKIVIKKNSWIAAKCIIGPGVEIKENSFLKIGSIITHSKN
jgi:putative colanic acid biosynthesis acetyltransferase WcaF